MDIPNACKNKIDERDYKYSNVFKMGAELPEKVILDNVEYQNQ